MEIVAIDRDVNPLLPEEKLLLSIFHGVFIYKVMSSVGNLALIWATVVLLGGFVTLIKPLDFWIVTTIIFIQAIRLYRKLQKQSHLRSLPELCQELLQ